MNSYILAIDQGTTGTTALVMSTEGATLGRATCEFPQHFPQPGWVEHEPDEIWESVERAAVEALRSAGLRGDQVSAIGITNQRETTLMWERDTGKPLMRAIVWQDRRTQPMCEQLRAEGHEPRIRELTGLVLDPYFSGTKAKWMLDHVPLARERAATGALCFGTVDSYLVWRLCGGAEAAAPHLTDVTNASRTLLMDLQERRWSLEMCARLDLPLAMLPAIRPSAGEFGSTRGFAAVPDGTPITGMAGDQHAALFGQGCFGLGDIKCTYGTGAFILVNTGNQLFTSGRGLLTTVAWQIGEDAVYALEGGCFVAGAAVQWLRDGLGLIQAASEVEQLARQVQSSEGVSFVPALAGLGAPHWKAGARGTIGGITRGTRPAHLARATLEGIAHQVADVVEAMATDLAVPPRRIRVDGGAAANDLLMQMQADLSGLTVDRPADLETTARGAAMLAGIGSGLFQDEQDAARMIQLERVFDVKMDETSRRRTRASWADAVSRCSAVV